MREPKNQMLGTMEPPLMQLSVKVHYDTKMQIDVAVDERYGKSNVMQHIKKKKRKEKRGGGIYRWCQFLVFYSMNLSFKMTPHLWKLIREFKLYFEKGSKILVFFIIFWMFSYIPKKTHRHKVLPPSMCCIIYDCPLLFMAILASEENVIKRSRPRHL